MSELNLDNAICSLVVRALNNNETKTQAWKELKVSHSTLYRWMKYFNIVNKNGKYIKNDNIPS